MGSTKKHACMAACARTRRGSTQASLQPQPFQLSMRTSSSSSVHVWVCPLAWGGASSSPLCGAAASTRVGFVRVHVCVHLCVHACAHVSMFLHVRACGRPQAEDERAHLQLDCLGYVRYLSGLRRLAVRMALARPESSVAYLALCTSLEALELDLRVPDDAQVLTRAQAQAQPAPRTRPCCELTPTVGPSRCATSSFKACMHAPGRTGQGFSVAATLHI